MKTGEKVLKALDVGGYWIEDTGGLVATYDSKVVEIIECESGVNKLLEALRDQQRIYDHSESCARCDERHDCKQLRDLRDLAYASRIAALKKYGAK